MDQKGWIEVVGIVEDREGAQEAICEWAHPARGSRKVGDAGF